MSLEMSGLIDLTSLDEKVLATRERGEKLRNHYSVSKIENEESKIKIMLSENLRVMTASFFLGMFASSVVKCGSKEKFLEKFQFDASERIQDDIDDGIRRALRKRPQSILE